MIEQLGTAVWLTGPRRVELRAEPLAAPADQQILVSSLFSALSHGTERLAYRGQINPELELDLPTFQGSFNFPLKYGYACTGIAMEVGGAVTGVTPGDAVFALHPHQDRFVIDAAYVTRLPEGVTAEHGVFFAQLETAVNVLLDANPRFQETVVVFGQGVVGLLITHLLSRLDLSHLIVVDPVASRRSLGLRLGATLALEPSNELAEEIKEITDGRGADTVIEVSGTPAALRQAIPCVAVQGTVVVASWYGEKPVTLDLGSAFHRRRLRLVSSQVGMLDPALSPRWDRARRTETVCRLLPQLELGQLITHRIAFSDASKAYELIDSPPDNMLQVILTYENNPERG